MTSSILKSLRQAAALFLICALPVATLPGGTGPRPYGPQQPAPASDTSAAIPPDQLDSLVAPIALYPDPLLAQVLAASTYPLEIVQLQQFLDKNTSLTGQALTNAVMQQNWDPSVQALAVLPDVVKVLSENIKWTADLGNAFLAQQDDVMNAVQRMRLKAQGKGQLKTTEQQTVQTKVVENQTYVVIEPSSPDVVYVPSYDPMVVYGEPAYPYPPVYYPGYVAGRALWFGAGLAIGAAWGGGWGWNCGWGGNNNININNNNNFINNSNRQNINNPNRGQGDRPSQQPSRGNNWQHNPQHRGGAPYGDRATAKQYGGAARGDSMANRQASARQNIGQMGGQGQLGNRQQGGFQGGAGGLGGADRVGTRDVSRGAGNGAFGGASSGMSGPNARASQSRGASSMGSRGSSGRSGGYSGGGRRGGGGGGGRRR
ncbi:MAG TPA: DUF3300 domain-containing protein [Terriglobales bacterium]|nr:DUF3300 domain-containing protein [Terriglobales bacterium]